MPTGHRRERRGEAGERMATDSRVQQRRQRDEHEIGRVGGVVGHHADDADKRRQDHARRVTQAGADKRAEQADAFGDAGAEHHQQHEPQGRKAVKVRGMSVKSARCFPQRKATSLCR